MAVKWTDLPDPVKEKLRPVQKSYGDAGEPAHKRFMEKLADKLGKTVPLGELSQVANSRINLALVKAGLIRIDETNKTVTIIDENGELPQPAGGGQGSRKDAGNPEGGNDTMALTPAQENVLKQLYEAAEAGKELTFGVCKEVTGQANPTVHLKKLLELDMLSKSDERGSPYELTSAGKKKAKELLGIDNDPPPPQDDPPLDPPTGDTVDFDELLRTALAGIGLSDELVASVVETGKLTILANQQPAHEIELEMLDDQSEGKPLVDLVHDALDGRVDKDTIVNKLFSGGEVYFGFSGGTNLIRIELQ